MKKFILALGLVAVTGAVSVKNRPATQAHVDQDCIISFC